MNIEMVTRTDVNVLLTPDGRFLLSLHPAEAWIWDVRTLHRLHAIQELSERDARCVAFVPPIGGRLICWGNATIAMWDIETGKSLPGLTDHEDTVADVSIMPDGGRAVSASHDRTLRVWDMESGECIRVLKGHHKEVVAVAVSPGGHYCVSGSWDQTLRIWDLITGKCLRTFEGHVGLVNDVTLSADGRLVLSSDDDCIRIWDLSSGQCLHVLEGEMGFWGLRMKMTPDGRSVIFKNSATSLSVCNIANGTRIHDLVGHRALVHDVQLSADGRRIMTGGKDKTLRVWDLDTGRQLTVFRASGGVVSIAANLSEGVIVGGTTSEEVLFLEPRNIPVGSAILTATNPQQARCPVCCQEFTPPPAVVAGIQEKSQKSEVRGQDLESGIQYPNSALRVPSSALLSTCPHCQHPLHFNPFFSTSADYTDELSCGLEFSRREKGPDHDETLAHVDALAVHLERAGKSVEAAEFRREHNMQLTQWVQRQQKAATTWAEQQQKAATTWAEQQRDVLREHAVKNEHLLGSNHDSTVSALSNLAMHLQSMDAFDEAEAEYRKALDHAPDNMGVLGNYAFFLQNLRRDFPGARDHYVRALLADPTDAINHTNYAGLCLVMGNQAQMEQHLCEAWRLVAGKTDRYTARVLFLRTTLAAVRNEDATVYLGQLKTLFDQGIQPMLSRNVSVREHLQRTLPPDRFAIFDALYAAINEPDGLARLKGCPDWQAILPVPLDTPWPEPKT